MTEAYPKREPISKYFDSGDVDRWGKVVTELVGEVWALSERVRRLEQSLDAHGVPLEDREDDQAHIADRAAFLRRSFWPFLEEAVDGGN